MSKYLRCHYPRTKAIMHEVVASTQMRLAAYGAGTSESHKRQFSDSLSGGDRVSPVIRQSFRREPALANIPFLTKLHHARLGLPCFTDCFFVRLASTSVIGNEARRFSVHPPAASMFPE